MRTMRVERSEREIHLSAVYTHTCTHYIQSPSSIRQNMYAYTIYKSSANVFLMRVAFVFDSSRLVVSLERGYVREDVCSTIVYRRKESFDHLK